MRGAVAVLLLLAGCAAQAPETFRDQDVPISSTSRFDAVSFSGDWHVVEAYPSRFFPSCTSQKFRFDLVPDGRFAGLCGEGAFLEAGVSVDPLGRLQIETSDLRSGPRKLWIFWLSEDLQTAAIGTPSGEMGWILNRSPDLRSDRLKAAREVLAFNGYKLSGLRALR